MRSRVLVCLPLSLLVTLAPARGRATAPELDPDVEIARRHFQRGGALYVEGRYEEALAEFERARVAKPLPAFDYNIARVLDRLERWPEAIAAYERFLAAAPESDDSRPEATRRVALLRARVTVRPPAGRGALVAGGVLSGVGLGLVAAGGAFTALANTAADDLSAQALAGAPFNAARYGDWKSDRAASIALFTVGGAVLVGGVVALAVGGRARARGR